MQKIACYKCSGTIEIKDFEAFSKIHCPSCKSELNIPKICGNFVLTEKISGNQFYETFKGHRSDSDELLVIKLISECCKLNDQTFSKMKSALANVPECSKMDFIKSDGLYIASRPFYETSIESYLKNCRPKAEKAVYILDQAAAILEQSLNKNVFPTSLTIGNLLMDKNGQLVISDLLFRESLHDVLQDSAKDSLLMPHLTSLSFLDGSERKKQDTFFAFGCLSYTLCCGNPPWPFGNLKLIQKVRDIPPEIILNLRGEYPESLKLMIKELINEKENKIASFEEVRSFLKFNNTAPEQSPAKPVSKKKAIKSANKAARIKNKRKKTSSKTLPLLIGITALLALSGVFFFMKGKEKPLTAKVETKPVKQIEPEAVKKAIDEKLKKSEPPELTVPVKESSPELVKVPEKVTPPPLNREAIKAELMPPDFNFDPIVGKLDEYINATKKEERELEEDKIEIVSLFRDHILIHFYRHPYTGTFHLQNKAPIRAQVVKANENEIQLLNLISGKPITVSWKDLEFTQFKEFADYYAASYTESFSLSENNDEIFKKVSEEYITLAVVLDWYGFKEEAVEYKKKALAFDSSQMAKLDLMIKEDPTN